VASTVHLAERGHWSSVVTAVLTLALLVLLANTSPVSRHAASGGNSLSKLPLPMCTHNCD
jgi:hypothetical protein